MIPKSWVNHIFLIMIYFSSLYNILGYKDLNIELIGNSTSYLSKILRKVETENTKMRAVLAVVIVCFLASLL